MSIDTSTGSHPHQVVYRVVHMPSFAADLDRLRNEVEASSPGSDERLVYAEAERIIRGMATRIPTKRLDYMPSYGDLSDCDSTYVGNGDKLRSKPSHRLITRDLAPFAGDPRPVRQLIGIGRRAHEEVYHETSIRLDRPRNVRLEDLDEMVPQHPEPPKSEASALAVLRDSLKVPLKTTQAFKPLPSQPAPGPRAESVDPAHMRKDLSVSLHAAFRAKLSEADNAAAHEIIQSIILPQDADAALRDVNEHFGPKVFGSVVRFHQEAQTSLSRAAAELTTGYGLQSLDLELRDLEWPDFAMREGYGFVASAAPMTEEAKAEENRFRSGVRYWRENVEGALPEPEPEKTAKAKSRLPVFAPEEAAQQAAADDRSLQL